MEFILPPYPFPKAMSLDLNSSFLCSGLEGALAAEGGKLNLWEYPL
jgi:hypothetical protein